MKTTSSKTDVILIVMKVLTWITFFGLFARAGAILISYSISMLINHEGAKNVYMGLNLFDVMQFSLVHYSIAVLLLVAIGFIQAYIAWLLIKVLSGINLANPFTIEVALLLERMSYFIIGTWCVVMVYDIHASWLKSKVGVRPENISGDFIFFAGMIFIIAQIFKKGVEIQSENELTV